MSQEGFASFIPDDLPGFNSLNGSGFFDQAGEWGDLSSDSAAEHDAFDSRTFKLVRTNSPRDVTAIQQQEEIDVSFVDVSEDEEEDDELDISQFLVVKEEEEQKPTTARPSRRRSTGERPVRTERRRTAEGKKVRRHRSSEEGAETRQRTSRRTRSGEAPVPRDSRRRSSTQRRRPENSSRKGMDLGAKLDRLGNSDPATVVPETPRRRRPSQLRKSHSIPLPEDDAVSVGSRQSRQSTGCPRTCRRRRATLSHNLLARNLQQLAASGALEQQEPSMDISCKSNREEAWKSRRRRSAQVVNAISVPALAA